jgi:TolB-like protein
MSDIFLSYSRADQATAKRFADGFKSAGFSVWWDQSLNPGEAFDKVTEGALEDARAVVVLWSRQSVDSRWVRAEATQANSSGKLVPAMIESCKRPIMFELTHTADLSDWNGDVRDQAWQSYVAGVRRFVDKDSPAAATAAPPTRGIAQGASSRAIAIAVVAALLITGVILWALNRKGVGSAPAATPVAAASTAANTAATVSANKATLAVLPFADLSAAHDQEYFSDGLTEELLNQLAQIQDLRVTARTSSFSFKGKNEDVRVIGQKLGVANLLEGSVRKDGTHVRITAQLVNGSDGSHLWSQTYDREMKDIFALQEEVAKDVAKALSIKLDVGDLPRVQGGTTNVEAYDIYLKAREFYVQGGAIPSRQAVQLLRKAVALDPQFSRAWLLLAYSLSESTVGVPDSEADSIRAEGREAAQRVLKLSPDAWWAQDMRANGFMVQHQWAQAEAAIAAGAAPNASYESNGARLGFLGGVGRARELAQRLELATQLDPLSFIVSGDLQIALDAAGQPAKAQAEYERSKGLSGIHQRTHIYALLRLLARKDTTPAAIGKAFQTLLGDEKLPMPLSHALAKSYNNPQQAREDIRKAIDDPANQDRVRMTVIAMYADGFGERDLALVAMRRTIVEFHSVGALWFAFKTDLRTDPRFKELVRRVGLADYFRTNGTWNDFCKPVGVDDFECH